MMLAGILSASMLMSMSGAAAVYAEEETPATTIKTEQPQEVDPAAEDAAEEKDRSTEATGEKKDSNTDVTDQKQENCPPEFRKGNRMMPPQNNNGWTPRGNKGRMPQFQQPQDSNGQLPQGLMPSGGMNSAP